MTVSVPPRWLASEGSTVAQTRPPAAAMSAVSLPMWMSCTLPDAGLILDTEPFSPPATHRAPPEYATPAGTPLTSIVRDRPVRGAMRHTVPPASATQTLPAPTARPAGLWPIGIAWETRLSAGSTRSSRPACWLVTHTAPAPAATLVGAMPRGIVAITWPVTASILVSVPAAVLATQTDP